jgi:CheY-like chemotaxis protein
LAARDSPTHQKCARPGKRELKSANFNRRRPLRSGLKAILAGHSGWEICAEAETGEQAVALATRLRPDVVILDLNLSGITGLQASTEIKRALPGVELVILTCQYSAPFFMLLAENELLTAQERAQVRTVAKQMRHPPMIGVIDKGLRTRLL